jgi:hypothetical protein
MRHLMTGFSTVTLGLALVATAEAGPGRGSSGSSRVSSARSVSYSSSTGNYISATRTQTLATRQYSSLNSSRIYSTKSIKNYSLLNGTKFAYGLYYKGPFHYQWSCRYWCPTYGCWYYYDPYCCCSYYWCGARSCWYPISYATVVTPVAGDTVSAVNEAVPVTSAPPNESGPVVTSGPSQGTEAFKVTSTNADSEEK